MDRRWSAEDGDGGDGDGDGGNGRLHLVGVVVPHCPCSSRLNRQCRGKEKTMIKEEGKKERKKERGKETNVETHQDKGEIFAAFPNLDEIEKRVLVSMLVVLYGSYTFSCHDQVRG